MGSNKTAPESEVAIYLYQKWYLTEEWLLRVESSSSRSSGMQISDVDQLSGIFSFSTTYLSRVGGGTKTLTVLKFPGTDGKVYIVQRKLGILHTQFGVTDMIPHHRWMNDVIEESVTLQSLKGNFLLKSVFFVCDVSLSRQQAPS